MFRTLFLNQMGILNNLSPDSFQICASPPILPHISPYRYNIGYCRSVRQYRWRAPQCSALQQAAEKTMSDLYDTVIIGAGPAGAHCAGLLAKKGFKVILCEQEKLPCPKTCGGAIPKAVFEKLPFSADSLPGTIGLANVRYTFGGSSLVERFTNSSQVYSVDRSEFDYALVSKAVSSGCELIDNEKIRSFEEIGDNVNFYRKNGGTIKGKFGVLACGSSSSLLSHHPLFSALARKSTKACASLLEIVVDDFTRSLYKKSVHIDFALIKNGYGGIIPKTDHLAVCLYQMALSSRIYLKSMTMELLRLLDVKGEVRSFTVKNFYVYTSNRKLGNRKILVAGDAGALADPLSGEGIRHAIHSGEIAASVIEESLEGRDTINEYSRRIHSEIGRELLLAGKFVRIAHLFPSITYGGLINVSEEAAAVLNGSLSYSALLDRLKRRIFRMTGSSGKKEPPPSK